MAAKLTRLTHKSDITAPSGRELVLSLYTQVGYLELLPIL